MESREAELKRLIREQGQDDTKRIWPENSSIAGRVESNEWGDFSAFRPELERGCALHGFQDMRFRGDGRGPYCRVCATDNARLQRRARGIQPKHRGCKIHGLEFWATSDTKYSGRRGDGTHSWCRRCRRDRMRKRREATKL